MMKVPLITCVLLTFISLGVSLDCKNCTGIDHCNGITTTCSPEENMCGIMAVELLGIRTVAKGCVPPNICNMSISTPNLNKIGFQRTVTSCCAGNECNKNEPKDITTVNGKMCPACYSLQNDCGKEKMECVGDEVHCFEISATGSSGLVKVSVTVKGCSNDVGCNVVKQGGTSLKAFNSHGFNDLSFSVRCAAPACISGVWGLLFPSLTGLLLVRLLA